LSPRKALSALIRGLLHTTKMPDRFFGFRHDTPL
jgi:hypothetical protein